MTPRVPREARPAPHGLDGVRSAAVIAIRLHPGPVGELLARELLAYADFGHRFGSDPTIEHLTGELLAESGPPLRAVPGESLRV